MAIRTTAARALRALRRLLGRDADAPRVQIDSWQEGGVVTFVALAQGDHGARGLVARLDTRSRLMSRGEVTLEPCPSHHDLRAVAAMATLAPMTWRTLTVLGLAGAGKEPPLAAILARPIAGNPKGPRFILPLPVEAPPGARPPARAGLGLHMPRLLAGLRARAYGTRERFPEAYGFPKADMPRYSVAGEEAPEPLLSAPGRGTPRGVARFPGAASMDRAELERLIARRVDEAMAPFRGPCVRDAIQALGPHGWTASGYAWYSAPGETGRRRLQAAAIHPSFAPTIAAIPAIAGRVDAGRPFEAALLETLRPLCSDGGPLTAAALHRMRAFPPHQSFETIAETLAATARIPVDWLPVDPRGWADFHGVVRTGQAMLSMMGLRLPDLAHETGRDWAAFLAMGRDGTAGQGPGILLVTLSASWDMAQHLRATLISPLARSLGIAERNADEGRLAARILFEGKALRSLERMQGRWHAVRSTMDARMPPAAEGNAWPAAFAPYEASGGIRIECLTDEAALRAEGGEGPDAAGIVGLGHCVGGYARNCYTAESFVASVRRLDGGRWTRLSTLELRMLPDDDGEAHLGLVQHRGAGNADPAPEAVEAVEALLAALEDGVHPVNAAALEPRDASSFIDAYDWRIDGALEQAFDAWRPSLPAGVAHAGLDGLRRRLATDAEGWPATADPGMPAIVAVPMPEEAARLLIRNIRDYHQDRDLAFPVG